MHFSIRAIVCLGLLFGISAEADPVTWTFVGGSFMDGGTISGSFTFDADTGLFSNIDVTTAGGSFPGAHYTAISPSRPSSPSGFHFVTQASGDLTGTNTLDSFLNPPMTNLGGTIPLFANQLGAITENTCLNATCGGTQLGRIIGGGILTAPPAPLTPTLLFLWFFFS